MNWRKLLAKLNPRSPSIAIGNGGVPEFSAQDIAAALGMVRNRLGRELLCLVWWPDGATITRNQLRTMALEAVLQEQARRLADLTRAQSDVLMAEAQWAARNTHTREDHARIGRLRGILDDAKRRAWPSVPDMYPRLVEAVLHEIATPNLCPECGGSGQIVAANGVPRMCITCDGHGVKPVSDRQRAALIGRDATHYLRAWAPVYEWMLGQCRDAEFEAGRQLAHALSGHVAWERHGDGRSAAYV